MCVPAVLRIAAVLVALSLGACALAPPATSPRAEAAAPPGAGSRTGGDTIVPGAPADGAARASRVLLERSRAQAAAGSYAAAETSVERALRIAPNDARLWLELAQVKLAAGDTQQAGVMARKALTLAGADTETRARAEKLIDSASR